MKIDRPRTTPGDYIKFGGNKDKQLNFKDLYDRKASTQELPWINSRLDADSLKTKLGAQKLNRNALNFVPENGFETDYEMFPGLGRFDMETDYDFAVGRPSTPSFPEQQPDFDPNWNNSYGLSPVIPPEEKIKNPFPRQDNIDPNGYLAAMMAEGTNTNIPKLPEIISENPQTSLSI
jgi:hypothetical protein